MLTSLEAFQKGWNQPDVLEKDLVAVNLCPANLVYPYPLVLLEGVMPDRQSYELFVKYLYLAGYWVVMAHTRHGVPVGFTPDGFRKRQFKKVRAHMRVLDKYEIFENAVALGYSEGAILANDIQLSALRHRGGNRFSKMVLIEPAGIVRRAFPLLVYRSILEQQEEQRRHATGDLEWWWQEGSPESGS